MTINEILEQAKSLNRDERKQLVKSLVDMLDAPVKEDEITETGHWGRSLNQLLDELGPIELVDSHIEDPVEWVKAQRQKQQDRLKPYWDGDL